MLWRFYKCLLKRLSKRLEKHGVIFSNDDKELLKTIREKRNKIEHFGITDSYLTLVSYTSKLLNFIMNFLSENFDNDNFKENEKSLLDEIRFGLKEFDEFVRHRWDEIKEAVEEYKKYNGTLTCPSCLQDALVSDDGTKCLFCGYSDKSDKVADRYNEIVLGICSYASFKYGDEHPQYHCPECGSHSLINDQTSNKWKCFNCGITYEGSEIRWCEECGVPFTKYYDSTFCRECREYKTDRY